MDGMRWSHKKLKENWRGKGWFSRNKWLSMSYVIKLGQAMSKCWHSTSTNNVWGLDRLSNEFSSLFRKICNNPPLRILNTKLALPSYKKKMRKKNHLQRKKSQRLLARIYIDKENLSNGSREGTQVDFMPRMQNGFSTHKTKNLSLKLCKNQWQKPWNHINISMKDLGKNSALTQYESSEERMWEEKEHSSWISRV